MARRPFLISFSLFVSRVCAAAYLAQTLNMLRILTPLCSRTHSISSSRSWSSKAMTGKTSSCLCFTTVMQDMVPGVHAKPEAEKRSIGCERVPEIAQKAYLGVLGEAERVEGAAGVLALLWVGLGLPLGLGSGDGYKFLHPPYPFMSQSASQAPKFPQSRCSEGHMLLLCCAQSSASQLSVLGVHA